MVSVDINKIADKGTYYEMPVSIGGWAGFYDEDTGPDTIVRVSKSVAITWQDEQGQRLVSFSEYLKIIKKLYPNWGGFRMVTPVQDAKGYIIAFADGRYS